MKTLQGDFESLDGNVKNLERGFKDLKEETQQGFKSVNDKLNITTNVNLAQILNEQTRARAEVNKN